MRPSLFVLLIFASNLCFAQQLEAPQPDSSWSVTFENDVFVSSDDNYTDGVQIELTRKGAVAGREQHMLRWLCRGFGCRSAGEVTRRTRFGQLMYTPNDITIAAPQPLQRPWAGLLYAERSYEIRVNDERSITFTGRAGITGRYSFAEEAQKFVHKYITDSEEPRGWDNQVGGSLGLLGSVKDRRALRPWDFGSAGWSLKPSWYWQAVAGNIMTYAALGASFSIGANQPPLPPEPDGVIHDKRFDPFSLAPRPSSCLWLAWLECTVFGNVEARAVAFNVFLDGRPGRDDPGIGRRTLVADASIGVRLTFPGEGSFLQLKMTERSREIDRRAGVGSQRWGAFTFGSAF